jgi:hypothetical protein
MAASSDVKDKEKIPVVDGSDEEESQSEEEYEIEAILGHQASKAKVSADDGDGEGVMCHVQR